MTRCQPEVAADVAVAFGFVDASCELSELVSVQAPEGCVAAGFRSEQLVWVGGVVAGAVALDVLGGAPPFGGLPLVARLGSERPEVCGWIGEIGVNELADAGLDSSPDYGEPAEVDAMLANELGALLLAMTGVLECTAEVSDACFEVLDPVGEHDPLHASVRGDAIRADVRVLRGRRQLC